VSLQDWRASESRSDGSSSDPSGQTAVQFAPSWARDLKSLLVLILAAATIGGVIYEWSALEQRNHPKGEQPSPPTVSPATKANPLRPFCPPERDECWR
jgi:hypothetical protein